MAKRKRKPKEHAGGRRGLPDLVPFYMCMTQLEQLNRNVEALAGTMVTIGLTHGRLVEHIEELDRRLYRAGLDTSSAVNGVSREIARATMRPLRLWDRVMLWWQNRQWRKLANQTGAEQKKRMEELTGPDAPSCKRWK